MSDEKRTCGMCRHWERRGPAAVHEGLCDAPVPTWCYIAPGWARDDDDAFTCPCYSPKEPRDEK